MSTYQRFKAAITDECIRRLKDLTAPKYIKRVEVIVIGNRVGIRNEEHAVKLFEQLRGYAWYGDYGKPNESPVWTYHAETIDEAYEAHARYGARSWEVDGWVTSFAGVARGKMDVVSDAVLALTGHAPMTLSEFLRRYPERYQRLLPA